MESIAYDVMKAAIRGVVGERPNELWVKTYDAIERAVDRFHKRYGSTFGEPSKSFLAYQHTWDAIARSMFYSAPALTADSLHGAEDAPWPPVTDEALKYLLSVLEEELRTDWRLDRVLTEKQTHLAVAEIRDQLRDTAAHLTSLTSAAPAASRAAQATPYDSLLDRTKALLDANKPTTALEILLPIEAELASKPVDPHLRARLYNHLGSANLQLRQYDVARTYFERVLEYDSTSVAALNNIAAARLLADDFAGALSAAERVIADNPADEVAWQIRLQAAAGLGTDVGDPPGSIASSPKLLLARAQAATIRGDWDAAVYAAKESLRLGARTAETLVALAHALLNAALTQEPDSEGSAEVRVTADQARRDQLSRAVDLAGEAIAALEVAEMPHRLATALLVRGVARRRLGHDREAMRDLDRASTLTTEAWEPLYHYASIVLEHDGGGAALFVIDSRALKPFHPALVQVRGRALIALHRVDEAEGALRDAVRDSLGQPEETDMRILAAELLIEAGKLETAAALVQSLPDRGREWSGLILRGRVAAEKGEAKSADTFYETAIRMTPRDSDRRSIQLEYGHVLGRRGDYSRAIDQFEAADAANGPDSVRRLFFRTLFSAGHYERLADHLDSLASEGELPYWAHELAALIAHVRNDLPSEVRHLQQYLTAHSEDIDRTIQLAHAYQRQHRVNDSAPLLAKLRENEGLTAVQMMRLAHLSARAGANSEALEVGFKALRRAPHDYGVQVAFASLIIGMRDDARVSEPDVVGPGTSVTLESDDGDVVEYVILTDEPVDILRGEALPTDDRVRDLMGLRAGDTVRRGASALSAKTYTVREIKSAAKHAFQQILLTHHKQFPSSSAFEMFKIGDEPTLRDFAPIIRTVEAGADRADTALALHGEKLLPLGTIADVLGTDVPTVYNRLTETPGRRLMTEFGEPHLHLASVGAAQRAVRGEEALVITYSALLTAQKVGFLGHLATIGRRRLVPRALVDDLEEARAKWMEAASQGYRLFARGPDGRLQFYEWLPEEVAPVLQRVEELLAWTEQYCEVLPLPAAAAEQSHEQSRDILGREAFAAIALARSESATLFADDLGLRGLARNEYGVEGFSSWALLQAATAEQIVDAQERDSQVLRLIEHQHHFIPVTAEFLHNVLRARGYQLDGAVLRALGRLGGPETDVMSAISVGVELVRALATSSVGRGAVESVVKASSDAISTGRPVAQSLAAFSQALGDQLRLLPLVLVEARRGIESVFRSKQGMPRS